MSVLGLSHCQALKRAGYGKANSLDLFLACTPYLIKFGPKIGTDAVFYPYRMFFGYKPHAIPR